MSLEEVIGDVFSINPVDVTDSLELRDVATWDSMSHMLLITRLEESFNVQFTGDEIADFRSIGDIRNAIEKSCVRPA